MVLAMLTKTVLITLDFLCLIPCPSGQSLLSVRNVVNSVCYDQELKALTIDETCVTERFTKLNCATGVGGRRDPPGRKHIPEAIPNPSPTKTPKVSKKRRKSPLPQRLLNDKEEVAELWNNLREV